MCSQHVWLQLVLSQGQTQEVWGRFTSDFLPFLQTFVEEVCPATLVGSPDYRVMRGVHRSNVKPPQKNLQDSDNFKHFLVFSIKNDFQSGAPFTVLQATVNIPAIEANVCQHTTVDRY